MIGSVGIEECRVGCICGGDRKFCIQLNECTDRGAGERVSPEEGNFPHVPMPEEDRMFIGAGGRVFSDARLGRHASVGEPGGAVRVGRVIVDSPRMQSMPTGGAL